jgi:hypothetical protein
MPIPSVFANFPFTFATDFQPGRIHTCNQIFPSIQPTVYFCGKGSLTTNGTQLYSRARASPPDP